MLTPVPPPPVAIGGWEEALTYLRGRSTDLAVAQAEIGRAEAQVRMALAGVLPTLQGSLNATHQFIANESLQITGIRNGVEPVFRTFVTPQRDVLSGQLALVAPLVNLRTWDSIGIARDGVELARTSVEDVKRNIALNVANAIVGVVTAERISELNRVGLRNALERLALTTRKQTLGAATGLDVLRVRQDAEAARATLVTGDESLRQSRESLGLALGVAGPVGLTPGLNLAGIERSLSSCKSATNLEARADITAAKQRLGIAKRNVHNARLEWVPSLQAQSTAFTTTADTGIAPNTTWNIQGVLSFPFFDGGVRYGRTRDALAQETQASERLTALRRTATVQLAQAERGVRVAEEARRVAAAARDLAQDADQLVRAAFAEGQGTSLELVTAASALRQADISLALREFELVRARLLAFLQLATCPW